MNILQTGEALAFGIIKKRHPDSHKGMYGTVTAVCGSGRYRGAAALAVRGALCAGAGIVRLASTEKVVSAVASKIDECIFCPLAESDDGAVSEANTSEIIALSAKSSAMLIGCGLSVCGDTRSLVRSVVKSVDCALVLDADALNIMSEEPSLLKSLKRMPVITPHVGEMSRLCGVPAENIKTDRHKTALEFSKEYRCVTVLKDSITVIASPDGRIAENTVRNPGLSKGGSGDVLAGITLALLGQGYDPFDAAVCAVTLHSLAAADCAAAFSYVGMQPSDIPVAMRGVFLRNGY